MDSCDNSLKKLIETEKKQANLREILLSSWVLRENQFIDPTGVDNKNIKIFSYSYLN